MTDPHAVLPVDPVSTCYGYDRGTPVDRVYIENFLAHNASLITGHAAEIKDDTYIKRYGRGVTTTTVIDIDTDNPHATLRADLNRPNALPADTFDALVVTHTLQLLADPITALDNCQQALVPGGTLFLTVPTVGRLSASAPESDYWRITPRGLAQLLSGWNGQVTVTGHGNLATSIAMLLGHAAEELTAETLNHHDPRFPLLVCARAHRTDQPAATLEGPCP